MVKLSFDVTKFFIFAAILALTNMLATSLGLCIGAAISNVEVANAATPVIIMPLLLAGGLFANNAKLDPYWCGKRWRWSAKVYFAGRGKGGRFFIFQMRNLWFTKRIRITGSRPI